MIQYPVSQDVFDRTPQSARKYLTVEKGDNGLGKGIPEGRKEK